MRLTSGRVLVAALIVSSLAATILLARAATVRDETAVGPSPSMSPSDTPFSPHVPARTLPGATGTVLPKPQSAAALPGVTYAVRLLAPCVVLVDFDGSFWRAPADFTLLKPTQPTTVTLLPSGGARMRTGGGQVLHLVRTPGPLTVPACPPHP